MKGQQLSHMLVLATQRHDGQFDKGGMPYILHPLKVMHYLRTDDEELQCIALGHDLIEDTFQTVREGMQFLSTRGFSERVVRGIADLSKVPGEEFEQYKERVKANPDAVAVKMADLRHNSDIRRLKGVTPKDIERIEKYHRFYLELRDLTPNVQIEWQSDLRKAKHLIPQSRLHVGLCGCTTLSEELKYEQND